MAHTITNGCSGLLKPVVVPRSSSAGGIRLPDVPRRRSTTRLLFAGNGHLRQRWM